MAAAAAAEVQDTAGKGDRLGIKGARDVGVIFFGYLLLLYRRHVYIVYSSSEYIVDS